MNHVFKNTNIANIGDAAGLLASGVAGNLYVALFTDAVVVSDSVVGTETSYTGYARIPVARGAGWTVSGNSATNAGLITFGLNTAGTPTICYVAIYTALTGGDRLYWGALTADLILTVGVNPVFVPGSLVFTED